MLRSIVFLVVRGAWPAVWTFPVNRPTDNESEYQWSYLKFDLADAPRSASKATLHLKVAKGARTDGGKSWWFDVYRGLDDSWSESTLSWSNRPTFDAMFLDQVHTQAGAGSWIEVDVSDFIKRELAGDRRATLVLAEVLQQKWDVEFHSSEAAPEDRPYLSIDGRKVVDAEDGYVYPARPEQSFGDVNEWTTLGLYWEPGKLEFYVNDQLRHTYTSEEVCRVPSFLLLSAQIGGWDGNAKDKDQHFDPHLPGSMYVDYVKMWSGTKAE